MGIESFVARLCVQTAVYWGTPVDNGYGGKTFATAVEVSCRWEDTVEKINRIGDRMEEEIVSRAQVYVTTDVQEKGYLYLGALADLSTAQKADPTTITKAYMINRFDKIPVIRKTDKFLRKAYL